jgi:hypothetical protein
MTLLQQALAHYTSICSRSESEKRNGWQCAQALAKGNPEMLGDLPRLLTTQMLELRDSANCATTTSKPTSQEK